MTPLCGHNSHPLDLLTLKVLGSPDVPGVLLFLITSFHLDETKRPGSPLSFIPCVLQLVGQYPELSEPSFSCSAPRPRVRRALQSPDLPVPPAAVLPKPSGKDLGCALQPVAL